MKRVFRVAVVIILIILSVACTSCGYETPYTAEMQWENGEKFTVTLYSGNKKMRKSDPEDTVLSAAAENSKKAFDSAFSYVDANSPTSPLAMINSEVDRVFDCDGEIISVISKAQSLINATKGAVLFKNAGDVEIDGNTVVKNSKAATVDLTDMAKGYAIAKAAESLRSNSNVSCAMISSKNCVAVIGSKPDGSAFNISFEGDDGEVGYFTVSDGFVFALDSQNPESQVRHVAVYSSDAVVAQTFAHAALEVGTDAVMEMQREGEYSFAAVIVENDKTVKVSDGATEEALFTVLADGSER